MDELEELLGGESGSWGTVRGEDVSSTTPPPTPTSPGHQHANNSIRGTGILCSLESSGKPSESRGIRSAVALRRAIRTGKGSGYLRVMLLISQ